MSTKKASIVDSRSLTNSHQYRTESTGHLAPLQAIAAIESLTDSVTRQARERKNSHHQSIHQEVVEAQKEFVSAHQSSSLQTVFAITNTMVGSVCLVVPQVFLKNGIFSCLLVMVILGLIQLKTCQLIIHHQRADEVEVEATIKRILGNKWAMAFRLSSGTLLFIVGVVYFLLINSTLYPILEFIFKKIGFTNYTSNADHPVFDQFSIQYLALILFIPLAIPQFLKNIGLLLKLAEVGVVAIFSYGVFIIYIFFSNIQSTTFEQHKSEITYFTFNISEPAGQFALAFMIHNAIGTFTSCNRVKENNSRDLSISYFLAGLIYGMVGVLGAIGIVVANHTLILIGQECCQSINYPKLLRPRGCQGAYHRNTLPGASIFSVSNLQLHQPTPDIEFILRGCHLPEGTLLRVHSSLPPNLPRCSTNQLQSRQRDILAFDGAVCGFFMIYIVPIGLHMTCYYPSSLRVQESVFESQETSKKDLGINPQTLLGNTFDHACVEHPTKTRFSKNVRWAGYGVFVCIGLFNMGIQFKQLFKL